MPTPPLPPVSAALLEALERSRALGFLGPGDLGPQVHHALGFAEAVAAAVAAAGPSAGAGAPTPGAVLDLGSGGGLPGLVLAEQWPRASIVLLDSSERRTTFLAEAAAALGWEGRVTVLRERAELAARSPAWRGHFDVVVARSFGPPAVTAECAAPFLRVGGLLVVSEPPPGTASSRSAAGSPGPSGSLGSQDAGPGDLPGAPAPRGEAADEGRWPASGLAELGLAVVGPHGEPYGYQVLRQARACPDRYPRRVGIPAKRPLYRSPSD